MATGRVARVGWGVAWVVAALLGVALVGVLWVRATSVPRVSGVLRVPGVSGVVSVTRDGWGVPHIRAASDADAMFALGFVHWQDRAWQMEFQRRVVQGRLSEVLGRAAVPQDTFLRTWGFQRAAQSVLPALRPRTRALVRAYTAGVNAAMAQGKVALEFRVLGFRPQPWTDVDSVSWSKLMAYDLGGNMDDEVLGSRVLRRLGPGGLDRVTAPYPPDAPTVLSADEVGRERAAPGGGPGGVAVPAGALAELRAHLAAARALGLQPVPGKGSNGWVLAGSRTASGKPILADDPHLSLSSPMLWYLADVRGDTLRVIGASIPGLPAIVIGRNDRVAWGVTNMNPDVQDLYVEPRGAPLTSRTEVIRVRGGPDVRVVVRESAHGPVVGGAGAAGVGAAGETVALKWTALQPGDTTMDAFLGVNVARDWASFTAALERYVAPSQNFVYADVDGNTGYIAPGRVPVRRGWDGSLPVPGDGRFEWAGFVPFAQLPRTLNPPDGLVVTANNKVQPDSSALGSARNWAEPYRAERITALLTARPSGVTVADVTAVQLDTVSLVWRDLRDVLLRTVPADPASADALARLRGWDGNMVTSSVPALIFEAWLMQLQRMAQDELGDATVMNSASVAAQLASDGELCRDDARDVRDCAAFQASGLAAAVADLAGRLGRDPAGWTYGRVHTVASTHRAFGGVPALAWLFNHAAPTPGGTNTVNVARPEVGSFRQTHGPSYRQVVDLADPDASVYVGSLGQGGHPLGGHVADQQARWVSGRYLPMSTRPADWGRVRTLTLQPGR